MPKWSGKSKGTVLGYRIFIFLIRKAGVKSAYLILYFVATYYFLFLWTTNKHIFYYFRQRQGFSFWKSVRSVYRSYFVFGQTLIDKFAIQSGLQDRYTYEFDGVEYIKELLAQKKGGIMLSAHVGNFEISEYFFNEIDIHCQINMVTADQERSDIKEYLETISGKTSVKQILIKEDMSHVFEISKALENNELICFTGDRYFEGSKALEGSVLGEEANFPAGPFMIASRMQVPVLYVYVMKEKNMHYHLYARKGVVKHRDAKALLNNYTENLEEMLRKYPYQWFNYFDFWGK